MILKGKVDRLLYSGEDGYIVAMLESGAKIAGHCFIIEPENLQGQEVVLEVEWEEHPRFGPQFRFESIEIEGSQLYFYLTKVVKGIGKKLVARLIEHYGEEALLQILDNEPETLLSFKGIKEKKLSQITKSWQRYRQMRDLAMFLAPYKVSQKIIGDIYRTFVHSENIIEKIKKNPYIIVQVQGVGFKRADEMALSMGMDPHASKRLEAAIVYAMQNGAERVGDSALEKGRLIEQVMLELQSDRYEEIERALDLLVQKKSLVALELKSHFYYAHPLYYQAEKSLYDFFQSRLHHRGKPIVEDLEAFLKKEQENLGIVLDDEQRRAVELLNEGITLLTMIGYAGTGKSTSAKILLTLLAQRYGSDMIMTTALSGIATQRIHETTGFKSATIQSLLVSHKDMDTFPFDVLLLDEASMVNARIFSQLCSKLKEDAVFIIVGDEGQLPPIGAGNVLFDILSHRLTALVKLTKIYRQNEEQTIPLIADSIRRGQLPKLHMKKRDFHFVEVSDDDLSTSYNQWNENEKKERRESKNNAILQKILEEAKPYVLDARKALERKNIAEYLTYLQVITPMKSGLLGVEHLNKRLQQLFNPGLKQAVAKGMYTYALFDKVVHVKNENMPTYTPDLFKKGADALSQRIYNGMIGYIFKINHESEDCYVYYPMEKVVVRYDFEMLGEYLMLSYALTIHKTQGMEYQTVIIPMTYSHYVMHNTKLLYTAITRAKKMCILVGEYDAFASACHRIDTTKRTTVISLLAEKAILFKGTSS